MALTVDELQIEIQAKSSNAASGIDELSTSLGKLRAAVKGGVGLTTTSRQFKALSQAVKELQAPTQKVAELVAALKPLETIGKSNLGSTLNQLKKIPEITAGLDDAKLTEFAAKIQQVTAAVRPLAVEMEKVSRGFSRLPANIQRAINANARLTKSNRSTAFGFNMLAAKISIVYMSLRRVAGVIAGWVKESGNYVENLNLFTVSMGEYADEALAYAEKVGDAMGIDPSEFMRFQAVFMNMTRGFGVTADRAYLMSKNLTQLGYDLASIFNVDFEIGMEKLQSAISGQPRPMREWGFDLSEATIKALALEKGIKQNVETMGQMEKSQLRYVQLIETAQKLNLTGNFRRELITTANQIRILQSQATQAARALGNIVIPALNAILPYAIAFLKVLRTIANEIANLFGFELPEIDYSGLDGFASGADDLAEGLEDATDAAKDLKKAVIGLDELNVLGSPTSGAGTNSELPFGGLDLVLPEYDFLGDALKSRVSEIADELEKPFREVLNMVGVIGAGMLAWKIGTGVVDFVKFIKDLGKGGTITLGVTMALVGFTLEAQGLYNIGKGDAAWFDYVKAAVGSALGVGGALLMFGTGPVGWTIGIGVALAVAIASLSLGASKKTSELIAESFAQSGAGGVSPREVLNAYQEYYDTALGKDNKITINLGFEVNRSGLQDFIDDLKIVDSYLFGDDSPTEEQVEEIKQTFLGIRTTMESVFDTNENVILSTFTKSFSEAANSIGKDAMIMRAQFLALSGEMSAGMAALTAEAEGLAVKIAFGTADEQELERYQKLSQALQKNRFEKENPLSNLLNDVDKIDLKDVEKAKGLIKNVETATTAYIDENTEAYKTALKSVQDYINAAKIRFELGGDEETYKTQMAYWDEYKSILKQSYQQQESSIRSAADDIFKKIQTQLLEASANIIANSGTAAGAKAGLIKYGKNTIKPIEQGIQESMRELGINGSTYATEALKEIGDTFMQTKIVPGSIMGATSVTFETELKDMTGKGISVLEQFGIDAYEYAKTAGLNIAAGYADGLSRNPLPTITITPSYKSGGGGGTSWKAELYASGGFPDTGQLFVAREAGPELVGTIGSRTAVANNDQITAGISSAVYQAFVSANAGGGGGDWNIQIIDTDGRVKSETIITAAERKNRRDGRTIIPLGV